jgi:tRNA(Arg) A34 adenosine deaminase TadA
MDLGATVPTAVLISSMAVQSTDKSKPASRGIGKPGGAARLDPAVAVAIHAARMSDLAKFTARSLLTDHPRPFGASVIDTRTGKLLLRALNAVAQEIDPSSHAEVRAIRKATKRLKKISLAGYTLYTTCEPCPMCMSAVLWAGLDRVVYGATIEDANRHCNQIRIPAVEVAARSDMKCTIEGPVLRDQCYALFTHPRMLLAFRSWTTRKQKA